MKFHQKTFDSYIHICKQWIEIEIEFVQHTTFSSRWCCLAGLVRFLETDLLVSSDKNGSGFWCLSRFFAIDDREIEFTSETGGGGESSRRWMEVASCKRCWRWRRIWRREADVRLEKEATRVVKEQKPVSVFFFNPIRGSVRADDRIKEVTWVF